MKIFNIILLIIWCVVIFAFSNENASDSSSTSYNFADGVINSVENITNKDYDNNSIIDSSMNVIRKCAHFCIYFILGVFTINSFKDFKIKRLITFAILFCFLYAISDEMHQLFLDGRSAQVSDVLLDTFGSLLGIFIYVFIYSKISKKSLYRKVNP